MKMLGKIGRAPCCRADSDPTTRYKRSMKRRERQKWKKEVQRADY